MIQRIALLIGGLGAAGVLAVALGFGNFIFAAPATNLAAADNQPVAVADTNVAAAPNKGTRNQNVQPQAKQKTVIDKVYVAPAPAPKVVHVTRKAPNTQPSNPTTTTPAAPATTPRSHNTGRGQYAEHDRGERGGD